MITVNGKDSTYRSTFASSSSSRVFSQVGCHISISKYLTKKGLHLRWRRRRQHPSRCVVCGGDCGGGRRPRRRARRPLRGRGQHHLCYPLPTQCRFKIFATVTIVCSKQYAPRFWLHWILAGVQLLSPWRQRCLHGQKLIERWKYEKLLDKKILFRKKPQIY